MDNYDLKKQGDKWKLQRQGAERAQKAFDTKKEGLEYSREYMHTHGGSLKIRKENGQIQEERTYPRSKDPKKTPG